MNLGQDTLSQQMVLLSGPESAWKRCVMSHHWNPTKKEIEKRLDRKIHKFVMQENRNPHLSKEYWFNRYMYTDIHETFFCTFPIELYKWLAKMTDS